MELTPSPLQDRLHNTILVKAKKSGFNDQMAELIMYETMMRWFELIYEKVSKEICGEMLSQIDRLRWMTA